MANAQIPFVLFLAASHLLLYLHGMQAKSMEKEAAGIISCVGTPPLIPNSSLFPHTSQFTLRIHLYVAHGEVKAPSPGFSIQPPV